MILLVAAALAVPVDADLRPWSFTGRLAIPEETLAAQFQSESGLLVDTARGVTREALGALPNTSPVWLSEDEPGVPLLHYRAREEDGATREHPWPRASSGAPDYLAVIREDGLRFVAARSQSAVLVAWTDDFDLRGLCMLDTGQLEHAASAKWRYTAATTSEGGTLYLLPIAGDRYDADSVAFAVTLERPGDPAEPACTVERVVAAGHDPRMEPTATFTRQTRPTFVSMIDSTVAYGLGGARATVSGQFAVGAAFLSFGPELGDQGLAGRWAGRLGVIFFDPGAWPTRGWAAGGIGVREHAFTERVVPTVWARRELRVGWLGLSARSEGTFARDTLFVPGFRFEQELGIGPAIGTDRHNLTLQVAGGVGVTVGEIDAWGGLRLGGATTLLDRPDWVRRARRLRNGAP